MESSVINGPRGAEGAWCGAALSLARHTIRISKSPMLLNAIAGLLLGQIDTAEAEDDGALTQYTSVSVSLYIIYKITLNVDHIIFY